jgi:hypothetical protein
MKLTDSGEGRYLEQNLSVFFSPWQPLALRVLVISCQGDWTNGIDTGKNPKDS